MDIDENGKETTLPTTNVDVLKGPGSVNYLSNNSDPLKVVQRIKSRLVLESSNLVLIMIKVLTIPFRKILNDFV